MKPQPQAIGYCRVSTSGQAENGVSLDAQKAGIQKWADDKGYSLLAVYTDAGLAGSRADNRPELQRALDAACKKGRALVVYSLSRLARSTRDTIEIADRLARAQADLVSLSENLDTTSAAGKMLFRMLAVLSEFERDLVSERTSAALQHKKANGERVGAVPFGFDLDPDKIHLRENPDEQAVVARMKDWRAQGWTYQRIVNRLDADGIPTKNRTKWYGRTVKAILDNAR